MAFICKRDSEVVFLCISLASYLLIGQDQNHAEYVSLLFKYQQFILIGAAWPVKDRV